MIQPEPEGSTQGYPLVSVEVLRSILTDSKETYKDGLGDYYSEDQYAISIKKIRRIRTSTHQRPLRKLIQYVVSREDQYAVLEIWNEYNILEDIKRGPYSKKLQYAVSNPLDTSY
ncbi:hypothetical protein Tco_0432210 [Tanacetum coccineum]